MTPRSTTIVATSFGFALVQLDVSILNVALARIGERMGAGVTGLQWIVDGYTIAFASFLLAGGALGDRLGARRIYVGGLALFTLASFCCGFAPGIGSLIAARIVQGVGAACAVPCSLALLTHACADDGAARARAVSIWTAAASIALSVGPPIGGVLVDVLGWRSIFLVNVPLGVIGIWLTLHAVGETPPRDGALDPLAQLLAVLTLLVLTGAIIEAGHLGHDVSRVVPDFAIGIVFGGAFLVVEARSRDPMLPLDFFRDLAFSAATLIGLAINLTLYGAIFVLGLYLQQTLGYSPLVAGLAFLPFPVALGVANIAAGRVGRRYGAGIPMALGLLVAGSGYWLLSHLSGTNSYAAVLPGLIVIPAGVGMAVPLMTSSVLSAVPRSRSGVASGVLNTARQAGGGIGVALFGALMAGRGVAGIEIAMLASAGLMVGSAIIALTGIRRPVHEPI